MTATRLLNGALSLILFAFVGCGAPAGTSASMTQQVDERVAPAYQELIRSAHVHAHVWITVAESDKALAVGDGDVTLTPPQLSARTTLKLSGNRSLTVTRTGRLVTVQSVGLQSRQAGQQYDLSSTNPPELVEIYSPGLDALQLLALARACILRGAVADARPLAASTGGEQTGTDYYNLTVNIPTLSNSSGDDGRWLQFLGNEDHGRFVDLRVGIERGRLKELETNLPVPVPTVAGGVGGGKSATEQADGTAGTGTTLHTVIKMTFA